MTELLRTSLMATTYGAISEVPPEDWNVCIGPGDAPLSHAHLFALEASGIAMAETGFTPCHIVLREPGGRAVAVAPAYLKTHSHGELGVDLGLSLAHERVGGPYYPKLQIEVPMIPFAGQRLLVRPSFDRETALRALVQALQALAVDRGAKSVQIGFMKVEPGDLQVLRAAGFAIMESNTYAWRSGEDRCFDDFLARMVSHGRSEIRRQRRRLQPLGLTFRHFRAGDIFPSMAEPFFDLYRANFVRHTNDPWLNVEYFRQVFATMPESVELSVCMQDGRWVGAVFSVAGPTNGYTYYWGQAGDIRFLHFELVFYRGIERALVTGLDRLDFGPTGLHKAERGIGIEPVHHALWFCDAAFREIAQVACARKTRAAEAERVFETARLPFVAGRKGLDRPAVTSSAAIKASLPPTLIQMKPGVGRGTLVLFPDFGGNTIYGRPVVQALGPGVSSYAMRLSKDMVAALDTSTIEDLGRRFAEDLMAAALARPLHLMGFSFAGCLAYETARHLSQKGTEPDMLWILDLTLRRPLGLREFLRSPAHHLVGLARHAKRNWRAILRGRPAQNILHGYGVLRIDMGQHPNSYRAILRGMYGAFMKYQAKPSRAPTTVVCAAESPRRRGMSEDLGWRTMVTGPFHAVTVPGNHLTMLEKPENARVIADHVGAVFAEQIADSDRPTKEITHD